MLYQSRRKSTRWHRVGLCGILTKSILGKALTEMKIDMRKIYRFEAISHPAGTPLPTGGDVYYECAECNHVVSSVPHTPVQCDCGNLSGKQSKIDIKDADKVKPMRGKLK